MIRDDPPSKADATDGRHGVGPRGRVRFARAWKAHSTGFVELRSPDAGQEPFVAFNLLSDPRDMERMKAGAVKRAQALAGASSSSTSAASATATRAAPSPYEVTVSAS